IRDRNVTGVQTCALPIYPEMHIPEQSSAIHGIYDADVADCPTFKEVAKEIARDIEGCDLAGFNSNRFDIPVLAEEFLRAGVDIEIGRASCRERVERWEGG